MFKQLYILLLPVLILDLSCKKDRVKNPVEDLSNPVSVFPVPPSKWMQTGSTIYYSSGFVGDAMPYFDNGKFHVFYLHDARDGKQGFHPIHKFITEDLVHYNYEGLMINYAGAQDQDLAIGTGSVIKVNGTYFCYYTGHNGLFPGLGLPMEGIMYAKSTDLKTWTKKTGFNMIAPAGYDRNEFRDPHVFFNTATNEYWMLVAGRTNGKAVIALFTSNDPSSDNWTAQTPIFVTDDNSYFMLECPDIFKMGNKWYLLFSENNTKKTTHYRIANSINGPWEKPANDVLDGEFYYAAKTASDGTNRYAFGWVGTKDGNTDYGGKQWAGNLVTHQLLQNPDGTLSVKLPDAVVNQFSKPLTLVQKKVNNATVNNSNSNIQLQTDGAVYFDALRGQKKISATIKNLQPSADVGFVFGYARPSSGDYYKLRLKNNMAYILKVQGADEYIDALVPFVTGGDVNISIVIDNSVIVAELNGKTTITGRSYWLPNAQWGVYSKNTAINFDNLTISGY